MPVEIIYQACSRIYHQGCSAYDEAVGFADPVYGLLQHMLFQRFFVKNDIRFDGLATEPAFRNTVDTVGFIHDIRQIMTLSAFHASVSQHRSMKFTDIFAACQLVKSIDVLGYDAQKLPFFLQLCQCDMSLVGFRILINQILFIIIIESLRMFHKKRSGKHDFRRISVVVHGVVQPCFGTEIRDIAFGGNTCSSKKHDFLAVIYNFSHSAVHLMSPLSGSGLVIRD